MKMLSLIGITAVTVALAFASPALARERGDGPSSHNQTYSGRAGGYSGEDRGYSGDRQKYAGYHERYSNRRDGRHAGYYGDHYTRSRPRHDRHRNYHQGWSGAHHYRPYYGRPYYYTSHYYGHGW